MDQNLETTDIYNPSYLGAHITKIRAHLILPPSIVSAIKERRIPRRM
jgi:hypothetical protein